MNMILFIGLQATGKSTFFRAMLDRTHVRINLDMLRTRYREQVIFDACLEAKADIVVDNTNLTRAFRSRYIEPAKRCGYLVKGYFFESRIADALMRNARRAESERVPETAIKGASRKLELPSFAEGFDGLYFVKTAANNQFTLEEWKDEI
jgi:predicted kinase